MGFFFRTTQEKVEAIDRKIRRFELEIQEIVKLQKKYRIEVPEEYEYYKKYDHEIDKLRDKIKSLKTKREYFLRQIR